MPLLFAGHSLGGQILGLLPDNEKVSAVLNVTVANPGAPGYLTAYPQGGATPTASNLDYGAGQVTAPRCRDQSDIPPSAPSR